MDEMGDKYEQHLRRQFSGAQSPSDGDHAPIAWCPAITVYFRPGLAREACCSPLQSRVPGAALRG
jgi:hypothetical protein